jgi:hypothetical protein
MNRKPTNNASGNAQSTEGRMMGNRIRDEEERGAGNHCPTGKSVSPDQLRSIPLHRHRSLIFGSGTCPGSAYHRPERHPSDCHQLTERSQKSYGGQQGHSSTPN